MNKAICSAVVCLLFAAPVSVDAQHSSKVHRIGLLSSQSALRSAERVMAFRQGLRDLGYFEGKNILIEYRWADGSTARLRDLATDLVRLKVDVIVTSGGTQAIIAAKDATSAIPIVISGGGDVVEAGLVHNFSHPGGNITGVTIGGPELYGKRLELLKDTISKLFRVSYLFNPTGSGAQISTKEIRRSAQELGLQVQMLEIRQSAEIVSAFDAAVNSKTDGLMVAQNPPISSDYKRIVDLTLKHRLAAIYVDNSWPIAGGLMSYGSSISDQHRRMANYVDRILKGANPGDLPIEQPTKFELVVNLKTAKQIGLTIPPNVLARADRVIR